MKAAGSFYHAAALVSRVDELLRFQCSHFQSFSKNATDTSCQDSCLLHCSDGSPRDVLDQCLMNTPAACRASMEIYRLFQPTAICGDSSILRLKFSHTNLSNINGQFDQLSYAAIDREQHLLKLKLPITPQEDPCEGTFEICAPKVDDSVELSSCSIESQLNDCIAINATQVTPNYVTFANLQSSIHLIHPYFAKEDIDIHIRPKAKSNCSFLLAGNPEDDVIVLAHETVQVMGQK